MTHDALNMSSQNKHHRIVKPFNNHSMKPLTFLMLTDCILWLLKRHIGTQSVVNLFPIWVWVKTTKPPTLVCLVNRQKPLDLWMFHSHIKEHYFPLKKLLHQNQILNTIFGTTAVLKYHKFWCMAIWEFSIFLDFFLGLCNWPHAGNSTSKSCGPLPSANWNDEWSWIHGEDGKYMRCSVRKCSTW